MHRTVTRLSFHAISQCRLASCSVRRSCLPLHTPTLQSRTFAISPALYKKKDKVKHSSASEPGASLAAASEDPFNLSLLHNGISTAVSCLKDDLSNLHADGQFNTASLEALNVELSKDSHESVELRDLAQVVPKGGRMVTILAAEQDYIKPITSAIVTKVFLNPQPDPHNALQLNIPIPPPTKESRDQSVKVAKRAFEKAAGTVRDSRGAMHKRLQDMQKKKLARPDDVRKAHEQMEKATEKGQKEVKDLFDTAKKALERTHKP
ncbi:hypothetical protein N7495_002961 [Penicillium taxi]|uniref:uncharacterized protein n=1 Tax=Penicillium taxi TaxID=168475 RepID=UPI0025450EFB|nr:uncharacterized protein N7495_002961 [Penicillium taxi]KAJ5902433.1 hypothetical protein N7495_002961 [Penicillium taxi]